MADLCADNRFDLIKKYKKELIAATNIESSPEEMAVLDTILFRFWQMGWLDKLEQPALPGIIRCRKCKYLKVSNIYGIELKFCTRMKDHTTVIPKTFTFFVEDKDFCSWAKVN